MKKGDKLIFTQVNDKALALANIIISEKEKIIKVLTKYETYKTAEDEITRSLDVLTNLSQNREYFQETVGKVAVFTPSNQPLYSYVCFAFIPSLMSEKVYIKSPEIMSFFYKDLINILKNEKDNIEILSSPRSECIQYLNNTELEVVIFTGTSKNANLLRKKFHKNVLFIANGSGHNPIIVTETANLYNAAQSIIEVCTYNQGQDCASPSSILIHSKIYNEILNIIKDKISKLVIGPYCSLKADVGPISRSDTLPEIAKFLLENKIYIDESTAGLINFKESLVYPTLILKPLNKGPNYKEIFAPIFFIQKYENDDELSLYFNNKEYEVNSMYITIYGYSSFINNYVQNDLVGKKLNDKNTLIRNSDLHKPMIERGFLQYGGYGIGASSLSKDGKIVGMPTLPQRDIFEYIIKKKKIEGESITEEIKSKKKKVVIPYERLEKIFPRRLLAEISMKNFKIYTSPENLLSDISKIFKQGNKPVNNLTLNNLVSILQSLNFNYNVVEEYLKIRNIKYDYKLLQTNLKSIKYLNKEYKLNLEKSLLSHRNEKYIECLSSTEMQQVSELRNFINNLDINKGNLLILEKELYNISKKIDETKKFYVIIYNLLFGEDNGPKLAPFIWTGDKKQILDLLSIKENL